jgi:hypothetical protein
MTTPPGSSWESARRPKNESILFLVGAGLGLFMQTLILALQNTIDRSDVGV